MVFASLRSDRVNAGAAWALVVGLLAVAAYRAATGEFLWAGLTLASAAVTVVPAAATRTTTTMPPAEVVALLAVPPVVRTLDVAVAGDVLTQAATYLSVATLALLVAVDLNALTDVEMSAAFAVAFVVSTTMAVAGAWTVVQFGADTYLGTDLLAGEDAVMWDLVVSTVTGVAGGLLFAVYFNGAPAGGLRGVASDGGRRESA